MCGRAVLSAPPDDLREIFGLTEMPELTPRFNIAPTQPIAIVREPGRLELVKWGLAATEARATRINVRAESIASAYRASFAGRRCLVVVDGFYEWQRSEGAKGANGANGKKGASRPFLVRQSDGKPFALAGIWERRTTADGEVIDECAVVTGAAKGVVADVHDRMPLVIPRESYARWLTGTPSDARALLSPSAEDLVAYEVSTRVNAPANDDAQCLEPAGPADAAGAPKGNLSLFD